MPDSQPFISVIVPVYNGGKFIGRCIDALLSNSYPLFEIIVVNDGSTDDSLEICNARNVNVINSERPRSGPGAARNLAALEAKGNVLLFVDADVVVENDTISKVAARFENDVALSAMFGSYDDSPAEDNFLSQYKNLQHHFVHQNSNSEASTFWAGLGAIRSDEFRAVGGFDCVQFAVPSIEDIELGARLRKAGHKILLDRTIQAKHLKRWDAISLLRTDIFCRAVPWSKLILTSEGLINDMNLKTNDRASALVAAMIVLFIPLVIWQPLLVIAMVGLLVVFIYLNRRLLRFYMHLKGPLFAAAALPWQLLYFLYSGFTFVSCWLIYYLPAALGIRRRQSVGQTR